MDHQFYPPLNIDNVFNRNINDKVMARFGFHQHSDSRKEILLNPIANPIAKSFSQDMNAGALINNAYFSNPNLYRSPSAVTINVADANNNNTTQLFSGSNRALNLNNGANNASSIEHLKYLTYKSNYPNLYNPTFPNQSFTNVNLIPQHYISPAVSVPPLILPTQMNALTSSSSSGIIRKLGQNEKIFHGSMNNNASYIFRAAIVTSEIDLYKNINLLNEAIEQWKSAHPLLRSRVLTRLPNQYPNNSPKVEKYFALASDAKLNSMDNVKYLFYNSHSLSTCDDIWKLLVEKETTQAMDGENGLLWRLTFFQIKNKSASASTYLYAIILAFDHSIMDGRSSYSSLLELTAIIEELALSHMTRKPKEVNTILPPKEELFKNRHPPIESLFNQRNYIRAPPFIDLENAYRSSYIKLKYLTNEEEQRGMIYTHDGRPYISVKELVQISQANNSKFRTLVITKNDLTRLLKKCKENGVKITAFINLANALAIRMIYDRYDRFGSHRTQNIQYTTNVSLREFPEYKAYDMNIHETIGCYIGLSFNSFKDPLKFHDPNWINDFWNIARRDSNDFHHRLDKGEYIHPIILPPKRKERDEFFYHFGNSNLGVMPSSITDRKLIKIRQAFATGRYSKENFLCWYSNLIATIDGQMCWTISFNTYFIRQEIIDCLIENLTKVIRELSR